MTMPDDIYYEEQLVEPTVEQQSDNEPRPTIWQRLLEIQRDLKVEKSQWNSFNKFYFRNREDILEAAKPLCHARGLVLLCQDKCTLFDNGWVYAIQTAAIVDVETGERVEADGWAREPETKKGSDSSQITGAACSYAGKRALGNLFAIDDTKDADSSQEQKQEPKEPPASGPFVARCKSCGTAYEFVSAEQYRQFITSPGCCPNPHWEVS